MQKTVLCVMGTRPEVIKMAPVVKALRGAGFHAPILVSAQHRQLLDQMLAVFDLKADWDLDAMRPDQDLSSLTSRILPEITNVLRDLQPNAVLAQGDTTTVFCTALAAFYARIPFGHVEAGLRSGDMNAPFPEEGMRRLAGVLSNWHFAPTDGAKTALLREGYPTSLIHVVGNTVIDALLEVASRRELPWPQGVPKPNKENRLVLITLHRRENFGTPLQMILETIRAFAQDNPKSIFIYPVHPNPNVNTPAHEILGKSSNVFLTEPMDYPTLVHVMRESFFVITDSGGIQEEGPALGKPILVCRDVTERPEAVELGSAVLIGSNPDKALHELNRLWKDPKHYQSMAKPRFPYGDGNASTKIANILKNFL